MNKLKTNSSKFIPFLGMSLIVLLLFAGNQLYSKTSTAYDLEEVKLPSVKKALPEAQPLFINFSVDSLNRIIDKDSTMTPIYDLLNQLLENKDTTISIIHLGDSHIQAGYYGGRTMRLLHDAFGNAGRGWIAPFKLAKLNEPDDYFINSVVRDWTNTRCTQREQKFPVGLGGIGIESKSPSINFDLGVTPINGAGYTFNQVVAYRDSRSMPFLPAGENKDSVSFYPDQDSICTIKADTFKLNIAKDTLLIQSTRRKAGTDILLPVDSFTNRYYGFALSNGQPGVLYHSIGVNGAMYVNYTKAEYVQQLSLLRPDLLIVSLGTNESFGRNFRKEEFTSQIRSFLSLVKEYLPHTVILLTTPAESYKRVWQNKKRVYVRNQNAEKAAEAIISFAQSEGIACWDLYAASGGNGSYKQWHAAKLFGRDRIHFTQEGYKEQGALLYNALIHELHPNQATEEE